jgi:hypothetical protein
MATGNSYIPERRLERDIQRHRAVKQRPLILVIVIEERDDEAI